MMRLLRLLPLLALSACMVTTRYYLPFEGRRAGQARACLARCKADRAASVARDRAQYPFTPDHDKIEKSFRTCLLACPGAKVASGGCPPDDPARFFCDQDSRMTTGGKVAIGVAVVALIVNGALIAYLATKPRF